MLYANGQPVGGGNANEKSLTLAEYNALPEAEKMNGTTYYITDAVPQGKKIQPVIYSTDEREIGVWTDGKPLYQKTIVLNDITIQANSSYTYDISSLGIDIVIGMPECFVTVNDNYLLTVPFNLISNYSFSLQMSKTTITFYRKDGDITCNNINITIKYTKLADTAGSGIWTPSGAPAVHYSTNEHVIGTWIDGNTLYEKTIFTNPTWSNNTASIQLTNEICKSIEGGVCDSSGGNLIPFGYAASSEYNEYVRIFQGVNALAIWNSFSASRDYVQITIRYTKSS